MSFALKTSAFAAGSEIPKKYTCDGADVSPALNWNDVPAGTQSFALIADDPDAPLGTWTHWIVWNIPAEATELPEGVPKVEESGDGTRQGRNDFQHIGYGGPCSPADKPHRYFFKLHALDAKLNLEAGASRNELGRAMNGHVLSQTELMGKYVAPSIPNLQATYTLYNNVMLGLLIVASTIVVAITAYSVLSSRTSAELYKNVVLGLLIVAGTIAVTIVALLLSNRKSTELMNAKDRQLAFALKDKDIQIERIKQKKDEQIEQIKGKALADKRDSDNRIALAEKSAALANQRASEIEKGSLELKRKLANRRITEEQHKILVGIFSKKIGQIIVETMGDPESGLYAADILKTFTDSGWAIEGKFLPQDAVWTGLILYVSPDPDTATVIQGLKEAIISFSVRSEARAKATIMVGGRPPYFERWSD
jgi:Raf kinase inhibitor-like YbhB/YbcL family protein